VDLSRLCGLPFAKMTGSGNDFVVFDGRAIDRELVVQPEVIRAICNRHNGIGADGLVVLEPLAGDADVRIHFFNNDGSTADLCGNATLCSTALSAALGLASAEGMRLATGAGIITSRLAPLPDGALPEIDLQPVTDIRPEMPAIGIGAGEARVGFAVAGIPHLVILCEDVDHIDLAERGPMLRWHTSAGPSGANVNWVSARADGRWRYRTFERGVEGETLACGTGAVATACLLAAWGLSGNEVLIRTSAGRDLGVRLVATAEGVQPTLRGEGRLVFRGQIGSLVGAEA
jgi:diaminopimelate epimerase